MLCKKAEDLDLFGPCVASTCNQFLLSKIRDYSQLLQPFHGKVELVNPTKQR